MSFKTTVAALALVLSAGAAFAQAQPATSPRPTAPAAQTAPAPRAALINVNTAGADELDKLPQIGPARAKDLIFSGRFVSAQEALAIGLVDELVPAAEVYATARERMARYVGGPALALRAAKEAIDRGLEIDLDAGLQLERTLFASLFATADREAGMTSFVEQGPGKATFTGR